MMHKYVNITKTSIALNVMMQRLCPGSFDWSLRVAGVTIQRTYYYYYIYCICIEYILYGRRSAAQLRVSSVAGSSCRRAVTASRALPAARPCPALSDGSARQPGPSTAPGSALDRPCSAPALASRASSARGAARRSPTRARLSRRTAPRFVAGRSPHLGPPSCSGPRLRARR